MKQSNRETLQRAIGIIEGVSYSVKSSEGDALFAAIEMLDAILNDKGEGATDEQREAD